MEVTLKPLDPRHVVNTKHEHPWFYEWIEKNGIKDGEYKGYCDGKLRIHQVFKKGKLHGKETYYDEDGKIEVVNFYTNGKQFY